MYILILHNYVVQAYMHISPFHFFRYRIRCNKHPGCLQNYRLTKFRFLIISRTYQFLNQVSMMFRCGDMLIWSFSEFSTLAKLKIPISKQRSMIETRFKNWHVQKNQLYQLRNRALIRAGVLITANTVCYMNSNYISYMYVIRM